MSNTEQRLWLGLFALIGLSLVTFGINDCIQTNIITREIQNKDNEMSFDTTAHTQYP